MNNHAIDIHVHTHDAALPGPPLPANGYGYTGAMLPAPPRGWVGEVVVVSSK